MAALRMFVFLLASIASAQLALGQSLGEKRVFENAAGQTMPYRLLGPNTPDEDTRYPLVVFLHGAGERGTTNAIQMSAHIEGLRAATQTDEFASYLIAPQLPSGGTFWRADQPYDLTMDIIESLELELPIDSSRIYLTGLSLGGFGTMNYLQDFPDKFAAAVPMSGGGNPSTADLVNDVPHLVLSRDFGLGGNRRTDTSNF